MIRTGLRDCVALILCVLFVSYASSAASAGKRVALVIGNSAYQHAAVLANPVNDAAAVAASLRRVGFEVIESRDLDRAAFDLTIRKFARALSGADAALLFYAGHGMQVGGRNYLMPIDARLQHQADLDLEAVDLSQILGQMEQRARTSIVLLDACRDNPLLSKLARSMGTRSAAVGRGLARVSSGVGTFIAFATEPGNIALDGGGTNSPFTTALVKHMETPGLDIDAMMRRVRSDVIAATASKQVPWNNSSLTGSFHFKPGTLTTEPAPPPTGPAPAPGAGDKDIELAYWNSVKDSKNAAVIRTYLQSYPNGAFALLAKALIKQLEAANSGPGPAEIARRKTEDAHWANVRSSGRRDYLEGYLQKYPNGAYAGEARQRLASLGTQPTQPPARPEPRKVRDRIVKVRVPFRMSSGCRPHYNKWAKLPGNGAWAISRSGACGQAQGYLSLKAARAKALSFCRRYAGASAKTCRIMAYRETVWKNLPRKRLLRQPYSMSGGCVDAYVNWAKAASHYGAWAISQNGACGSTAGHNNAKAARAQAIRYCHKWAGNKKSARTCRVISETRK